MGDFVHTLLIESWTLFSIGILLIASRLYVGPDCLGRLLGEDNGLTWSNHQRVEKVEARHMETTD